MFLVYSPPPISMGHFPLSLIPSHQTRLLGVATSCHFFRFVASSVKSHGKYVRRKCNEKLTVTTYCERLCEGRLFFSLLSASLIILLLLTSVLEVTAVRFILHCIHSHGTIGWYILHILICNHFAGVPEDPSLFSWLSSVATSSYLKGVLDF